MLDTFYSCCLVLGVIIWSVIALNKLLLPSSSKFTFYATSEEADFETKFHPKIYSRILAYTKDFENHEEVYIKGKKYIYHVSWRPSGYNCTPWVDVERKLL